MSAPSSPQNEPVTLTIRLIRSFEYRTVKNMIVRIPLTKTLGDLKTIITERVQSDSTFSTYRAKFDTFNAIKLYTKAFGTKTSNLVINMESEADELWLRDDEKTLLEYGLEHECELSYFNMEAYERFKANPEFKW